MRVPIWNFKVSIKPNHNKKIIGTIIFNKCTSCDTLFSQTAYCHKGQWMYWQTISIFSIFQILIYVFHLFCSGHHASQPRAETTNHLVKISVSYVLYRKVLIIFWVAFRIVKMLCCNQFFFIQLKTKLFRPTYIILVIPLIY